MVSRLIGWGKGILEDRSVVPMNKKLTYLETEPLTAEREWVSDGMAVLHASVRVPRPVPSAGGVFRRVRRYYQLQCQAFFRYCQRTAAPGRGGICRCPRLQPAAAGFSRGTGLSRHL